MDILLQCWIWIGKYPIHNSHYSWLNVCLFIWSGDHPLDSQYGEVLWGQGRPEWYCWQPPGIHSTQWERGVTVNSVRCGQCSWRGECMKNLAFHSLLMWKMVLQYYQLSLLHLYIFSLKGWENVSFELGSERLGVFVATVNWLSSVSSLPLQCSYINGSPQNTNVPGMIELAERQKIFIGGDDFKSGQTKMKSVLVDFLVSAGIKVNELSYWYYWYLAF